MIIFRQKIGFIRVKIIWITQINRPFPNSNEKFEYWTEVIRNVVFCDYIKLTKINIFKTYFWNYITFILNCSNTNIVI